MKSIITAALCVAMACLPLEQPKAQLAPAICISIVVVAAVGGAVVFIRHCQPKYAIVSNAEDNPRTNCWCQIAPRPVDIEAGDLKVVSPILYTSLPLCQKDIEKYCMDNIPPGPRLGAGEGIYPTLRIERSENLQDWQEVGTWTGPVELLNWSETNALASAFFYRIAQ
jgi:hypothetical protein